MTKDSPTTTDHIAGVGKMVTQQTTGCPCNPESAALCEEHCPHYAHTAAEIERLRAALANPPTDAMIRAALDEPQAGDESMYHRIWRAMAREAVNAR